MVPTSKADAEALEVAYVACGESRLAAAGNAGDLNVADLHTPSAPHPHLEDGHSTGSRR